MKQYGQNVSDYSVHSRSRGGGWIVVTVVGVIIVLMGVAAFLRFRGVQTVNQKPDLAALWEAGDYVSSFEMSGIALQKTPLAYESLIFRGFSAYQLALGQISVAEKAVYIEESINCLRKALIVKRGVMDGPVHYVLGKSYYWKGTEYADSAVESLEASIDAGFEGEDVLEYLGVAYARLQDYEESVKCLSMALGNEDNAADALLLALASSYSALEDFGAAMGHLLTCLERSRDDRAKKTARFAMADLYFKQADYTEAEQQYIAVLSDFGDDAEAHYRLGEISAVRNNPIQARAEYRKALRVDPAHISARQKLSLR